MRVQPRPSGNPWARELRGVALCGWRNFSLRCAPNRCNAKSPSNWGSLCDYWRKSNSDHVLGYIRHAGDIAGRSRLAMAATTCVMHALPGTLAVAEIKKPPVGGFG